MPDDTYTLSSLTARLGPATDDEVRQQVEGLNNAHLSAIGRRVATPRLAKELARNYGACADWLPKATPDQLALIGFTQDWLRVAVWAGRQAEIHHDAYKRGSSVGTDDKEIREVTADELRQRARRARERLHNTLVQLSGKLPQWTTRIDQAYTKSVTAEPAADSLAALGDVATAMLADTSPGMVARRAKSTLTADAVTAYQALAVELSAAAKAAVAARKSATVSQQDVDVWDGLALTLFEQYVDALEEAREEDPTVPAPSIIGLRTFFRRRNGSKGSGGVDAGGDGEAAGSEGTDGEAVG